MVKDLGYSSLGGGMGRFWYLVVHCLFVLGMAALCRYAVCILQERSEVSGLQVSDLESGAFREQRLGEELVGQFRDRYRETRGAGLADAMAATMFTGRFCPKKLCTEAPLVEIYKHSLWEEGLEAYQAVWGDLECFPLPEGDASYENSWLSARGVHGERQHEGCDLFGEEDIPGCYPVASITRGKVEQIGWLPLGGYRIGVRSPSGGYFYYAHLDSYGEEFRVGDEVRAGQLLGFMGNTGYGPEGTVGKFTVHLHLGIYIRTRMYLELSVNPYWILRYLDESS